MEEIYKDKIPEKTKWAFGLIGAASAALEGTVFGSITFFYNIKMGLSMSLIGTVWLIFGIWNAINDPIFGILEERTKTKIGRRIPYIRYGAPIYGLLFILSWFPFFGNTQIALFLNMLVVLFVFDTIYTLIGLVTYSLPAEMAITAKSRANLGIYTTILGAIGVLVSMVLPMFLLTGSETTQLDPAFQPTMIIVGIVSSIIIFGGSYFLYENEYTQQEESLGIISSLKACFKNKPFLIFESSNFLFTIAYTTLISGIFYYIQFILQLTDVMAMLPLIIIFISLFIFTAIFSMLVPKYGLKKIQLFGLFFTSLIFLICFLVADEFIPALIVMVFIGIGLAARVVSEQPIMGDLIDYDETLTGKRRETSYAGVNALFMKPSISIANWLYLVIFSEYGFDQTINIQSDHTKVGIMIGFFLVPAILFLFSAILFLWYPLHGKEWNSKKEEISKIHLQKEKDYVEYLRISKKE